MLTSAFVFCLCVCFGVLILSFCLFIDFGMFVWTLPTAHPQNKIFSGKSVLIRDVQNVI